jgi:hypothetical protein
MSGAFVVGVLLAGICVVDYVSRRDFLNKLDD